MGIDPTAPNPADVGFSKRQRHLVHYIDRKYFKDRRISLIIAGIAHAYKAWRYGWDHDATNARNHSQRLYWDNDTLTLENFEALSASFLACTGRRQEVAIIKSLRAHIILDDRKALKAKKNSNFDVSLSYRRQHSQLGDSLRPLKGVELICKEVEVWRDEGHEFCMACCQARGLLAIKADIKQIAGWDETSG